MNQLPMLLAVFLLINLLAALVRIMRGPTAADRMLAALLFGTTGVAILLLLAHAADDPAQIDVALLDGALVFALLAAITGAAFAQRAWRSKEGAAQHEPG
ncbi:MAG: cation:proton antiporter [Burkholderiaceae bacterium]